VSDRTRLPRAAAWLIAVVAPADWRDALAGDLEEERRRRRRARRSAGAWWALRAAAVSALRLRLESSRKDSTMRISLPSPASIGAAIVHAARSILRRPAAAALIVVTLTLGIGANTAIFSLANWLLLRPIPGVAGQDRLVTVRLETERVGAMFPMTVPESNDLAAVPAFQALAGSAPRSFHVSAAGSEPARLEGEVVSPSYFDVLGQRLSDGRGFGPAEQHPAQANVVVISDRLRHRVFGEDRAIGRTIRINGHPFGVIGVAAAGFRGTDRAGDSDLWVPLASHAASMPSFPKDLMTNARVGLFLTLLARLSPAVSIDEANAQVELLRQRYLAAKTPNKFSRARFQVGSGLAVPAWQRDGLRQTLMLLGITVALLLVLTCANVANLMVARSHERRVEIATRQALGASRGRIVLELLTEATMLTAAGGVLALAAAGALGQFMDGFVVARNLPALSAIELDWRVFAFAMAVSAITCAGCGLLPAVAAGRVDLQLALQQAGRTQAPPGRRLRRTLAAVQVAVSVALLSVGLLLVRGLAARYQVPLGFDATDVLAFSIDPGTQGYVEDAHRRLYPDLLARLRVQPYVSAATVAWVQPFRLVGGSAGVKPAGADEAKERAVDTNMVSPGFFATLKAPMLQGRDFTDAELLRSDEHGGGVVIVNEVLARMLFGALDVVGREIETSFPAQRTRTIVGVVADMRTRSVNAKPAGPVLYEPFGQSFIPGTSTFLVRLNVPSRAMMPQLRQLMRDVDPALPIYDVEMLSAAIDRYFAEERLAARLTMAFAALAALLAAVGLYGVLSRNVAERHREFGIRAALGAGPSLIVRLVTREALAIGVAGAIAGLAGGYAMSRLASSRLTGLDAVDPASMAVATATLAAMIAIACAVPVRNAMRVDVVRELK
jgi:predicted permease